jgi:hypothetical protein
VLAAVNRDNVAVSVRGKEFVSKKQVLCVLGIRRRERQIFCLRLFDGFLLLTAFHNGAGAHFGLIHYERPRAQLLDTEHSLKC